MLVMYGIKNCDTVRKARKWLAQHGIEYRFHDLRQDGLDRTQLNAWVKTFGWEKLLNKRGMTWRKLSEQDKAHADEAKALQLMQAQPAIIKRPILDKDGQLHLGFSEAVYKDIFKA